MSLEHIRCFREKQTVDLSDRSGRPARWTVLLGENGTGKTTVLQALATLRPEKDALTYDHGQEPTLYASGYPAFSWRPYLSTDSPSMDGAGVQAQIAWAEGLPVAPEHTGESELNYLSAGTGYPDQTPPFPLKPGPFYGSNVFAYGAYRRLPTPALTGKPSGPVSTMFDIDALLTNAEEWFLQRDYAAVNPRNDEPARNRAARLRDRVDRLLRSVLPDVRAFVPFIPNEPSGVATLRAETPHGLVPVSQLGLGYQSVLAWTVDLAARLAAAYPSSPNPLAEPAVVLVDEIDIHLHPRWQRDLLARLTEQFPNCQFIVTAHSPLIVQAAPDANIAVLRREGDHVVIDNDPVHVTNWRVDQILTSDLFGLPSTRPAELDPLIARRDALLAKPKLTASEKRELEKLRAQLSQLPSGETAADVEATEIIRRAAAELRARQR